MGMFSKISDEDLLVQLLARGGKPGHQSKEDEELASELLNRPHLIFARLLDAARGGQVQKSLMVIREGFPCLSKDEQEKAIRDIVRRRWVVTNDKLAITRFLKSVREATVEINEERLAHATDRPSKPPPATDADGPKISSQRIFQAVFNGWGASAHLKKVAKGRVGADRLLAKRPHLTALTSLVRKGRKNSSIPTIVEALKQLVADGYAAVVEGSFDSLDDLVLTPLKRPPRIVESPSIPPPLPKRPSAAPVKEPTKAPPTEAPKKEPPVEVKKPALEVKPPPPLPKPVVPEVVAKTPPPPAGPRLAAKEQLVIDALRLKKLKADGTIEGPVSYTQFNVLHGTRDETITVLMALIRKKLLTAEFKADKTPNWNTVRVVKVPPAPKITPKQAPVEVAPVVAAPAPVIAPPELSLEERVSQIILPALSQNPLMVELGARQRAEREELATRQQRELEALVLQIVTKAIKQQMG